MVYRHYIIAVAFLGALSGYILTALLSRLGGGSDISMVLAGIAVASLFFRAFTRSSIHSSKHA